MFKVQNPMLDLFTERCREMVPDEKASVLIQCYKNKLEYGCSYNNEIEQQISEIEIDTLMWELLD